MRHHYTPQNAQPNLVLGSSGPTRVDVGDRDPEFVPRPVGFLAELEETTPAPPQVEPLLWEGGQA